MAAAPMGTFDDLAAGWPPRVVTYYRDLAGRRHWPETVIDADGTNAVLRQVVNEADGRVGRYSWECIEDDDGGLAEVALDESLPRLEAIPAEDFEAAWRRAPAY